ncbi:hypothetical protein IC757_04845 [Wenzhouxiangella sp. AB-CW3]|uniref:sigma-E factor negative regulatory protein n=1 Tax=Wenzhouxiangella sp. AB-CW3 TaxID=2771012 RepID=UPI00168A793F|nr:RseA family anti-sigma factor [Wenzhouxiangella sp. AB-CW3]QOC23470.1 hypothetical protein IC757_04845 [Wenzhouxiangella sp. AB-CW3]
MSESNREHLSSLMDGELERGAQKFLLRRIGDDSDMQSAWQRFHTVRACLHGEFQGGSDLSQRVAEALADEPVPGASNSRLRTWLKPVAGGAIAASVALVAIVGINTTMVDHQTSQSEQPGFVSQSTSLDQPFARSTVSSTVPVSFSDSSDAERQRISGHVLRHHQASGGAGFVSYVPIVTGVSSEGVEIRLQPRPSEDERPARDSGSTGR